MKRNLLLDNAKFVMIFFVVLGHLLYSFETLNVFFEVSHKVIYSFHMPVFIIISGMLTKQKVVIKDYLKKLFKTLLVPLVVFTCLYEILEVILYGSLSSFTQILAPYWLLWYLWSLFIWRILAPYFLKLRYPILISVFIALMTGYFDAVGYTFGISKTVYFFPFFLAGYKLTPNVLSNSKLLKLPKSLLVSIILLNITFFYLASGINSDWLYGCFSYFQLGVEDWFLGPAVRLSLLAISFITSAAVLSLIPKRKTFFTSLGSKTLYIYLLHGFFIKVLMESDLFSVLSNNFSTTINFFIILSIACIITYICSREILCRVTNRLVFSRN